MKAIILSALLFSFGAQAQYPGKPVRVFVGYAAGSSTDIVGRVMADRLGAYWKQNVYVETRAGAAGNLAADATAHSPGDGYTLLFAQNGLAISAAALPNLPYRAEVNLVPGIQAVHVPYKGGAPAATDLMAGRIAYYFAGMPVGLPLSKSGRARALGVTSKQRFANAPEVPTIAEQGLPDYEATLWQGFFAPGTIAPELGARIAADIQRVLALPETRDRLEKAGASLFESDQASFRRFFHAEIEKWRGVVKKANLKLE